LGQTVVDEGERDAMVVLPISLEALFPRWRGSEGGGGVEEVDETPLRKLLSL
jgi:hypothetical protein